MHIWCKFGDSSSNLLQVITETSQISKNSKSKWPKWSGRPKLMTSIFNTSREYPRMHVWCKFCDSSPKLWGVITHKPKFPRILSQNVQHDLEGQGQWPPFSKLTESIPGCMFGGNLVILAQICDELSCGQGKVYGQTDGRTDGRTDRRTDVGNDNTPRSERPRGKKLSSPEPMVDAKGHHYGTKTCELLMGSSSRSHNCHTTVCKNLVLSRIYTI